MANSVAYLILPQHVSMNSLIPMKVAFMSSGTLISCCIGVFKDKPLYFLWLKREVWKMQIIDHLLTGLETVRGPGTLFDWDPHEASIHCMLLLTSGPNSLMGSPWKPNCWGYSAEVEVSHKQKPVMTLHVKAGLNLEWRCGCVLRPGVVYSRRAFSVAVGRGWLELSDWLGEWVGG